MKFKEFLKTNINEKLITFGGKAYPKFGQVVIISGGAGSGKGFIKSNLLGIEGKVLDVDKLKELVMSSTKIRAEIQDKFGIDVSKISLKNIDEVSTLHDIVSKLELSNKTLKTLLVSLFQAKPERKPNIIFDVTLKDLTKFYNIIRQVKDMGYYTKNISLVWVLNTIDVALAQNKNRKRRIKDEILLGTHQGASYTMSEIVKMGDKLSKYLDGELVVAFNQEKIDTEVKKSKNGGQYLKEADYVYLKRKGKPILKYSEIEQNVLDKIKKYIPNSNVW